MRRKSPLLPRPLKGMLARSARRLARLQSAVVDVATGASAARKPARKSPGRPAPKRNAPTLNDGAGRWQHFLHQLAQPRPGMVRQLSYAVYLPAGIPASNLPAVIMLHGCRQEMRELARGTRMNLLADAKGFAVIYAQQALRHNPAGCWRWFTEAADEEADAIAGIARAAIAQFGFDPSRIYVAGMSAGAGMAGRVALRHSDLIAAVAMHSGAVVGAASSARAGLHTMRQGTTASLPALLAPFVRGDGIRPSMPALILHGVRDNVVSVRNAEQLTAQFLYWNGLAASGAQTTRLAQGTRNAYRRIDYGDGRKTLVRLCLVDELGHAWSGGDPDFRYHAAHGPDASALVWRFFARHRRPNRLLHATG